MNKSEKKKKKITSIEFNSIVNSSLSGEKIFFFLSSFFSFYAATLGFHIRRKFAFVASNECKLSEQITKCLHNRVRRRKSWRLSRYLSIYNYGCWLWAICFSSCVPRLRYCIDFAVFHPIRDVNSRLYELCVKYRGIYLFRNRDSKNYFESLYYSRWNFLHNLYIYLNWSILRTSQFKFHIQVFPPNIYIFPNLHYYDFTNSKFSCI